MRRTICLLTVQLWLAGCFGHAQTPPETRFSGRVLLKAGRVLDVRGGRYIETLLAKVHDRMPVILDPENYDLWLDPGFKDLDTLTGMLKPFDLAEMKCYPVSTLVKSKANGSAECAAEVMPIISNETLF